MLHAGFAGADVELGLAALEISTGDVLYSQFRDSAMRTEMEAQLLFTSPREILQVIPLLRPGTAPGGVTRGHSEYMWPGWGPRQLG